MVDTRWKNNASPSTRPMDDRRRIVDHGWDNNRYPPAENAMDSRNPPKTVDRALKEDCHIEVKDYFLATVANDGGVNYFTSERLCNRDLGTMFNREQFMRALSLDGSAANSMGSPGCHGNTQMMGVRPYSNTLSGTTRPHQGRRRARTNTNRRNVPEETMPPPAKKIPLMIGNSDAVWQFYLDRFKGIQQNACKLIAKAWIKTVAPKKQSTHPYTGKNIPSWWPKPWGKTQFEEVRHREPDHLKKYERIPLCAHILRLVVEPNERQNPDIRRLNLTVAKLEEVATDALSLWFAESPNNQSKKPFLTEVLKVAKMEEMYKRGEIDANTDVFVLPPDRIPTEEDEEEDDDEGGPVSPGPIPADGNLSIMIHGQNTPTTTIPGPASMMALPSPSSHYGPGTLTSAVGTQQSPYMEHSTAMEIDENLQAQHTHSRRTSTYDTPPSEYASSLGHMPLYPSSTAGPAWQQTTSAPPSGSHFAYSQNHGGLSLPPPPPQTNTQAHSSGYVSQMDVQIGGHHYMPSPFDALPFRGTGANHGTPGYGQRPYGH
ncbi:Protein of unknown function (DUF2841) domain containing protein [Naviculisporaceae sp. PSN 640]